MITRTRITRAAMLRLALAVTLRLLISPSQALAQQEVITGSIAYSASAPSVIGLVSINNPGFEKTVAYQFPSPPSTSFTTPFFMDVNVEVEMEDSADSIGHRRVMDRNFDTTIVMTNTSAAGTTVDLTFFDQAGNPINGTDITPIHVSLAGKATMVLFVSSLLNP